MNYITLEDLLLFGSFLADFVIAVFAVLAFLSKKK
jgi:hypothetical protein